MPFDNQETKSKTGFLGRLANAIFGKSGSTGKAKKMHIKKIADTYSVTGQISPSDVALIKAAGFKTIMCNRPDGEEFGQPTAAIIKKAAEDHELKFFHVPMDHSGIGMNTMADFRKAVSEDNGPVLAYCRTGNRCSMLWKASKA